jgi:hypothetical protein
VRLRLRNRPPRFQPADGRKPPMIASSVARSTIRHRDAELPPHFDAEKFRRCDANNRHGGSGAVDGLGEDVGAPAKLTLPQCITDDRDACPASVDVIGGADHAPDGGPDTKRLEEVA